MEAVSAINTMSDGPGVVPHPFIPTGPVPMGLAQLQALGFLGYPPGTAFPGMNFFPPGLLHKPHLSVNSQEQTGHESSQCGREPVTSDADEHMDTGENVFINTDNDSITPTDLSIDTNSTDRKPILDRTRQKRQAIQDMTRPLKQWLYGHRDNPYPNKSEKVQLSRTSLMTMTQVSNWFANARRRLKNTVRGPDMTWAKRIKLYNNYVEGNQELLSIGSTSSSDDEVIGDCEGESRTSDMTEQEDPGQCDPAGQLVPGQLVPGQLVPEMSAPSCALSNSRLGTPLDLSMPDTNQQKGRTGEDIASPMLETSVYEPSEQVQLPLVSPPRIPQLPSTSTEPHPNPDTCTPSTDSTLKDQSLFLAPPLLHSEVLQTTNDVATSDTNMDRVDSPPKYKHSIMQRYLNDSCTYQTSLQSLNTTERDPKEKERHRNPSGSLSSHDYEEYMSSASSSRSTPTREHQEGHFDDYERFSKHWPDIKNRAEEDLYWKEISAALALTSLARSKYNQGQTH